MVPRNGTIYYELIMPYIDIMPTALYKGKLSQPLTAKQRVVLDYLKIHPNELSKEMYLLDREGFESLKEEVYTHIRKYEKDVCGFRDHVSLSITESWYRETVPNNNHARHNHPNSLLSGCIYVQVPPQPSDAEIPNWDGQGHGGINLEHMESRGIFKNFNFEYDYKETKYNAKRTFLPVETGDIILFPSYMDHFVSYNLSQENISRKIISFNTFIEGNICLYNSFPNNLTLKHHD